MYTDTLWKGSSAYYLSFLPRCDRNILTLATPSAALAEDTDAAGSRGSFILKASFTATIQRELPNLKHFNRAVRQHLSAFNIVHN